MTPDMETIRMTIQMMTGGATIGKALVMTGTIPMMTGRTMRMIGRAPTEETVVVEAVEAVDVAEEDCADLH
jgi:hypothetical protein